MKFNYQARTKTGKIQTGVVEASSREAAYEVLKSHELYVTAVEQIVTPFYAKKIGIFDRVTRKDVVIFSRQVAIMFKAKVSLIEIFETIAQQTRSSVFKEKILKIAEEVEGGTSLSSALAMFPDVFSPFYISMVKSGEASGKLTEIFVYLADYLEKESRLRGKIVSALTYPAFVLLVFAIVLTVILVFIIPQLESVLKSSENLPWITRFVLDSSAFFRTKVLYFLIGAVVIAFIIYRLLMTKDGRRIANNLMLNSPGFGTLLKKIYLTRFALNISTLISGGLPIVQSLEITSEVVGNEVYKKIILKTMDEVRKGEKMSSVLKNYPTYISPLFYQMIVVGEKTGTMDTTLKSVVGFFEDDVNKNLDSFVKMLEPLLIVFLGVVVGGLIISVLMPIYSMGGNF